MRRKLSLLIAFVGVLGLLGLAPAAQGVHDIKNKTGVVHETEPSPPVPDLTGGACEVLGNVVIGNSNGDGGVEADSKNHNHYRFTEETAIVCEEIPAGNDTSRYTTGDSATGVFTEYGVDAAGGTDGPWSDPVNETGSHGEDDARGWSHSACYDDDGVISNNDNDAGHTCEDGFTADKAGQTLTFGDIYDGTNDQGIGKCINCGEIIVECIGGSADSKNDGCKNSSPKDGSAYTDNWVKFDRVGTSVVAWGALHATSKDTKTGALCFLAELEFVPNPSEAGEKLNSATLSGSANIWTVNDKELCDGEKGTKKNA